MSSSTRIRAQCAAPAQNYGFCHCCNPLTGQQVTCLFDMIYPRDLDGSYGRSDDVPSLVSALASASVCHVGVLHALMAFFSEHDYYGGLLGKRRLLRLWLVRDRKPIFFAKEDLFELFSTATFAPIDLVKEILFHGRSSAATAVVK